MQGTEHLFNNEMIAKMPKGSYLVNTARGKICEANAVAQALESGHLRGYAGDVWYPQPAPKDHPWRTMPNHAMTPHYSGTTLDAQVGFLYIVVQEHSGPQGCGPWHILSSANQKLALPEAGVSFCMRPFCLAVIVRTSGCQEAFGFCR